MVDESDTVSEQGEVIGGELPEPPVGNRLSTGIEELDRYLRGGIPPGRMVAFITPPDTQSELLVKKLVAQRNTVYLTTLRPKWMVEEELRGYLQKIWTPETTHQVKVREVAAEELLEEPMEYLDKVDHRSNLIIDSIDELEQENEDLYGSFLNTVKKQLWLTSSVGIFYGTGVKEGLSSNRSITLRLADLVWQLQMSISAQTLEQLLIVSKFRGNQALTEPLELVLTDEIHIDTSRDIA